MPIGTPSIVTAAWDATDGTSYATGTLSPAVVAGRVLIAFSDTSIAAGESPGSVATGLSIPVWTPQITQGHPTTVRRVMAASAPCGISPVNGAVTFTMTDLGSGTTSTGTGYAVVQITWVRAAQPVVRVVGTNANSTSITLTLPKPLSVSNRWLIFKSHRANEVTTPRASPWAELSDVAGASPSRAGEVQWLAGGIVGLTVGVLEIAASASWSTSGQASIVAVELQAIQGRPNRRRWGRR